MVAILYRFGIYERLINSGIIIGWFDEFKEYWTKVLGGRPLWFNDFHFLLGIYRQKYQNVEVPPNSSEKQFLEAWQNPEANYQLFAAVRRFSYLPLYCYHFEKWIKNGDSILEYGCGIAPISYSLLNYSLKKNLDITIADIQQINSHFAKWRMGEKVNFLNIKPYQNCLNEKKLYDVVFMVTVMEHLPNPIETVKNITNNLKPNGVFIFDYILSDGSGLDTREAVDKRKDVLDYISSKYNLISGEIDQKRSMGTTVCKLK